MNTQTLEHLLTPIQVGQLDLPNRLVMPAMGTLLGENGRVSEALLAYWRKRVQGGAGLYITEITEVHPDGAAAPGCIGLWDDAFIPGLKKIADIVHVQQGKIALQLHHCGRESLYQLERKTAVAPSAIPSHVYGFLGSPREMTLEEIGETIHAFGAAAVRARKAGFDMVELHAAHGYLLMQFLSAFSNQRIDQYGGDFKSRSRFMTECLQEIRKQVGNDFPVSVRISAEEMIKGGYTIDDMVTIVPGLVAAGADLIHVSVGTHASPDISIGTPRASAPIEFEPGFQTQLARRVKEVAGVPVITVGRFTDPFFMDEVIARGDADMVAVGRQFLADPGFLKNALDGVPEQTMTCLACNQGCIEGIAFEGRTIGCAINPETGRELIYPLKSSGLSQYVWVIGGGPAGLTAAFEAARLGHRIVLFEAEKALGGNVRFAAMAPYKKDYQAWIETLALKCRNSGVDIRTETTVTEEMIASDHPDCVILATGAAKASCSAEGMNAPIVCDAWQILSGEIAPRKRAVLIGAGLIGLETADFLVEKGMTDMIILEKMGYSSVVPFAAHVVMLNRRLQAAGVQYIFNADIEKIEENAVIYSVNGTAGKIENVDQVIAAVGVTPRQELKGFLEKEGIRHFVAGDANTPRRILEATTEGAEAAWQI